MKPTLCLASAIAILSLPACEKRTADRAEDPPEIEAPMTGAYGETEVTPEVRAAAEFAVLEQSQRTETPMKLVKIARARRQIVAGTNYQFDLIVERDGATRDISAVVYENLESGLELTSWEETP